MKPPFFIQEVKKSIHRWVHRRSTIGSCILIALSILSFPAYGWGFLAHKKINEEAVFLLPRELLYFYKQHLTFIREEAVKPDKRRYMIEGEARRHYINIEDYANKGDIPRYWREAVERYDDDFLHTYGTLPWHLNYMKKRLTNAFAERNLAQILRLSADIGHYIADAHVPLHTTSNYDGQLTNQQGIHALWETRLVELFMDEYDFFFEERAIYIDDVQNTMWQIVYATHNKAAQTIEIERALDSVFPSTEKYCFEQRGQSIRRNYSRAYATRYHKALNGMVEAQMRASIQMVASIWFTAWVDAGCPNLSDLGDTVPKVKIEKEDSEGLFLRKIRPHEYEE